jgi:hypothetical protein
VSVERFFGALKGLKRLILVAATCLLLISANIALGQSGRTGWDGTWVGGWNTGAGVQIIFAGDTLIGFYLRNDYKDITRSSGSPDGGKTFAWDKGDATLTRSPDGGAVLVVHERGKPDLSIPLKREGG